MDKQERLELVNKVIAEIAKHGRKFFAHKERVCRLELDKQGRIYFIEAYSGSRIYTHYRGDWRKFEHGGTMRNLVQKFVEFVQTGKPNINLCHLGYNPYDDWMNGWGYPPEELETTWQVATPMLNEFGQKQLKKLRGE